MLPSFQLLVEVIQEDVRQQWRQGASLWDSLCTLVAFAPYFHFRFEVTANQLQNQFVLYLAADSAHEDIVRDFVEELLQVHVHDPFATLTDIQLGLLHCILCRFVGAEAITVNRKGRLKYRAQDLQQALLE